MKGGKLRAGKTRQSLPQHATKMQEGCLLRTGEYTAHTGMKESQSEQEVQYGWILGKAVAHTAVIQGHFVKYRSLLDMSTHTEHIHTYIDDLHLGHLPKSQQNITLTDGSGDTSSTQKGNLQAVLIWHLHGASGAGQDFPFKNNKKGTEKAAKVCTYT